MKSVSAILGSNLGNVLEWYDFGLFTVFSALFSRVFFPTENPHTALIATFSILSIGFLCRPLGALIFGYLGDRIGRAKTLRFSILMMALPTIAIGCLPTYQQVGILSPLLLTFIRMWQGVSTGGEYSNNMIYLTESAPVHYRSTITSFGCTSANLGILLALVVGFITNTYLNEPSLSIYAFRIPFLLSGILSLLIYYFRLNIQESSTFNTLKEDNHLATNPIKVVFTNNMPALLRTIGSVVMGTTFYFFCFIYLPTFLTEYAHIPSRTVTLLMLSLISCMIVLVPLAGLLSDYWGRKKVLFVNAVLITTVTIPGFYFLQSQHMIIIIVVLFIFTLLSSLEQGTTPALLVENFPLPARCTGVSLGYNIGNGFLGGTVPVISQWLFTHAYFSLAPALYITMCTIVTMFVILFGYPQEVESINFYKKELAPQQLE